VPDFRNAGTRDVFDGDDTNAARKILPMELHGAARRKMAFIRLAVDIDQLRHPPSNRLEVLSGNRVGEYSIRINRSYRICFLWDQDGAVDLEIVDYH
jgi:proteic killer suppression protein